METVTYLVQKNAHGKVKFIQFTLDGDSLTREWGLIGGTIQGTSNQYDPINVGKANEQDGEEVALAKYEYIWNKKIKEGYVPAVSLIDLPDITKFLDNIDLDNIPTEFCLSKPIATISDLDLSKLLAMNHSRMFVKYNGGCHYIVIGSTGEIYIFTRRWDNHTAKYPNIVKAVLDQNLPNDTMLAVELCVDPLLNIPHMTCQKHAAKINKTETNKGVLQADQSESHKLQEQYTIKTAVFGILYYDNNKLWDQPYGIMLKLIEQTMPKLSDQGLLFQPQSVGLDSVQSIHKTLAHNKKLIEGFVVWDVTKAMEVTMNGKPLRRAAWKLKEKEEKDVIAYGWENAKHKAPGIIGAIKVGQYDAQGNMVDLGTVGGLKPNEGETDPANWSFPCVIEVGYDNIFPETGKFQFGHFNKVHESKTIEEVEIFNLEKL